LHLLKQSVGVVIQLLSSVQAQELDPEQSPTDGKVP
jgi:hypothetical protein